MTLPDISRFPTLPAGTWRALGLRLREIGVTMGTLAPVLQRIAGVHPTLRRPIRAYWLRKLEGPAGHAFRMFLANDPVTPDEARAALGGLLGDLLGAGFLTETADGRVTSPFVLGFVDDIHVFADDLSLGSDAAMGVGRSTVKLCRAAFPDRPVGSALDVGCGAGACALLLARRAARVVGTDINARALALGRVNAAVNGAGNVEFREGNLFAPAGSETFDVIVSQPPFIAMPESAAAVSYLYGGARGDELSLRMLPDVSPHLAPGGRALLMIEWPEYGEEPLERRIRSAVASDDAHVLILESSEADIEDHCTSCAAENHPRLDEEFEREVVARRAHFERMGIRGLKLTLTVIQRSGGEAAWTHTVPVEPISRISVTSDRLDRIFKAREIAARPDRLLAARLRVPEGTVLSEEQDRPGADVGSKISARFSRAALVRPIEMTAELLGLVTVVHESDTVREAMERLAEAYEIGSEEAIEKLLPKVAEALLYGLLETA